MFGAVRRRVLEATNRRQRPHEYHSLLNDHFLSGPPPSERERRERVFWQSIRDSSDPADLEAYLAAWPAGVYAPLARNRLAGLRPRPSDPGSPDTPSPGFRNRLRAAEVERLTAAAGQGDARALARLRVAADANQVDAQTALGGLYDGGRGVSQDYAEAAAWYLRAARRGDADSQNSLGAMYQRGQGVLRDGHEAVRWFRRAADQGHVLAQRNLGVMYSAGQGVPRDPREAAAWYRRAADQGNVQALFDLGVMFSLGDGVARDAEQAAAWFRKAADQGHAYAQTNLGVLYNDGRGVPRDAVEAVFWYGKASEQGFATAQYYLGLSYRDGRGVAGDAVAAHMWFGIAAANGMNRARAARAAMERRMTRAQIARSHSRASTCTQSGYRDCGYLPRRPGSLPFGLGTLARENDR